MCCLPADRKGSAPGCKFSEPNVPPASASVYASTVALAAHSARLEARMESLLLLCRALSSPTMCRFILAVSAPSMPRNRAARTSTVEMHAFWSMAHFWKDRREKMDPDHALDKIRWMGPTDLVSRVSPGPKCEALNLMPPPLKLLIGTNSSSCGATNFK